LSYSKLHYSINDKGFESLRQDPISKWDPLSVYAQSLSRKNKHENGK